MQTPVALTSSPNGNVRSAIERARDPRANIAVTHAAAVLGSGMLISAHDTVPFASAASRARRRLVLGRVGARRHANLDRPQAPCAQRRPMLCPLDPDPPDHQSEWPVV